jgi:hypothetical protein
LRWHRFPRRGSSELGKNPSQQPKPVIPTEASPIHLVNLYWYRFPRNGSYELGKNPIQQSKPVIPTEASRRPFFSFAPANESAGAVESLFDLSSNPEPLNPAQIFQLFRAE